MSTRSPGPKRVNTALKIDCLAPVETTMPSALTGRPFDSSERCRATAARRSSSPTFGGYLVFPCWMDLIPDSEAILGVSKSGSPAERSMTSSPAALRRWVSWLMETVSDGFRYARFSDRVASPRAGATVLGMGLASTVGPLGLEFDRV